MIESRPSGPPRRDEGGDRLVIKLDPGGPVELTDLTSSFAALARMYERHYRPSGESQTAPRLFVSKLETGSIIAEIVPYLLLLGAPIAAMDGAMIISDFSRRISAGLKVFANPLLIEQAASSPEVLPAEMPSKEDARDLREFVKPLTGKKGANLGIKHARFEQHEGERHTLVEYTFDENELNRATVNIERALESSGGLLSEEAAEIGINPDHGPIMAEVMMFFEQASRKPGKEGGRTGDKGIVPDVSSKPLPVYFRKSFQNLKDQMVRGDVNPLTNNAFVVDVHVQRVNGEPKAYIVTNVHEVISLGDQK